MEIRLATDRDLDEVLDVDRFARAGDQERMDFLVEACRAGHTLIAVDGDVLGYAVTTPKHFFARDFIDLVMVREASRRSGVGRALVAASVALAKTPQVFSSTNESNAPMRALFQSEGWTLSGTLDGLDEGDPELVFFIDRE